MIIKQINKEKNIGLCIKLYSQEFSHYEYNSDNK